MNEKSREAMLALLQEAAPNAKPNCERCGVDLIMSVSGCGIDSVPTQVLKAGSSEALCADCIRCMPLRNLAWRDSERMVQQIVNAHYLKGTLTGAERQSLQPLALASTCHRFVTGDRGFPT